MNTFKVDGSTQRTHSSEFNVHYYYYVKITLPFGHPMMAGVVVAQTPQCLVRSPAVDWEASMSTPPQDTSAMTTGN